jgi:hypothetical protein
MCHEKALLLETQNDIRFEYRGTFGTELDKMFLGNIWSPNGSVWLIQFRHKKNQESVSLGQVFHHL